MKMYLVNNQPFTEKKGNAKSRHQIDLEEIQKFMNKKYTSDISVAANKPRFFISEIGLLRRRWLPGYPEVPDNYYLWLVPSLAVKPLSALQE